MDQPMSYCQKCGSELRPGEQFCDRCGALNIQPVKRARWNWLPWVGVLFAVVSVLYFGGATVLYKYREQTGYFDVSQRVTVTDAVNETYDTKLFGENTRFAYPQVSIMGAKTDSANKKIARDMEKYLSKREGEYAADYSYYVSKKVVSIVVAVCYANSRHSNIKENIKYFVYNISVSNGRMLNNEQALRQYGIGESGFINRVKSTYRRYSQTADLTGDEKKELLEDAHMAEPYFGKKGHLCFAAVIPSESGDGEAALFDSETDKELEVPMSFKN